MAIISLTALESGLQVDFDEKNIIRISDYNVNGTLQGVVEYKDSAEGFRKTLVIDEDETAAALLAAHLIPVTLFDNSEEILIASSKVSYVEEAISKKDGTTTVGVIRYDAGGSQPIQFETVEIQSALKVLLDAALVL